MRRYGLSLVAIIAVTLLDPLNSILGTTELSLRRWCAAIGIALSLLVVEELIKVVIRRRGHRTPSTQPEPAAAPVRSLATQ